MITCYKCGNKGHIKPFCPVTDSVQATQLTLTMKGGNKMIPNTWILLDSCSFISSISNVDLVRDIEQAKQPTRAWTNGGFMDYNLQCKLNILNGMTTYFNKDGIANILSLSEVSNIYQVTMDTAKVKAMIVYISKNKVLVFKEIGNDVYYHDIAGNVVDNDKYEYDCTFLSTVSKNKEFYSKKEIKIADEVRNLQSNICWPSSSDLKSYITEGDIITFPYTQDAVDHGNDIYGPQVPLLKGKTVRLKQSHVNNLPRINIPSLHISKNPNEEIDMDYFHVNGLTFFHTKSKRVKKLTTNRCIGTGRKECFEHIKRITVMYTNIGFSINIYNRYNAFRMLTDDIGEGCLNIVGRKEHVGPIERSIRTIKEKGSVYVLVLAF